jgi:hypothetical protein
VKKVLVVFLLIVVAVGMFLYFPRGGSSASAKDAATLAVLNTAIEGSRAGSAFAPALDGEIYATGDLVRANVEGRAVLTFFDGSTLSVDPGSQVKVVALNRVSGDGMQVTIEQSLGRSWSSVQKLKTPDSRYEVRTPSTTAVVRGTGFLTLVQQQPTGGTQTTYQVDEGTLQVTATAGGTVTVAAGQQVTIAEGAQAPTAGTPIVSAGRLEFVADPGLSFLVASPTGATCGPSGARAEIFGCVVAGNKVTVRDPIPGRWGAYLVAGAAGSPNFTAQLFNGATSSGSASFSRALKLDDKVRTGVSLAAGRLSPFEEPSFVNSLCAGIAPGRVFTMNTAPSPIDAARSFARDNKGTPVSVVFTDADLNQAATQNAPSAQGVTLSDAKITIDRAGIHGTAKAATQFMTLDASADVVGGPVGDKFTLRVARLKADPLPPGLIDALKGVVDSSTADLSGAVPFLVKQVAFRNGCLWISGVTPS